MRHCHLCYSIKSKREKERGGEGEGERKSEVWKCDDGRRRERVYDRNEDVAYQRNKLQLIKIGKLNIYIKDGSQMCAFNQCAPRVTRLTRVRRSGIDGPSDGLCRRGSCMKENEMLTSPFGKQRREATSNGRGREWQSDSRAENSEFETQAFEQRVEWARDAPRLCANQSYIKWRQSRLHSFGKSKSPRGIDCPCDRFLPLHIVYQAYCPLRQHPLSENTHRAVRYFLSLFAEAKATISGSTVLHVKAGSELTITCVVSQGPHELGTIHWYRGESARARANCV